MSAKIIHLPARGQVSDPMPADDERVELARFPRWNPDDAERNVMRVSLDAWLPPGATQSVRYVSLRLWSRGTGGAYFPTKTGVTIRVSEIEATIAALAEAARMLARST
jgi:hypothetical protein